MCRSENALIEVSDFRLSPYGPKEEDGECDNTSCPSYFYHKFFRKKMSFVTFGYLIVDYQCVVQRQMSDASVISAP